MYELKHINECNSNITKSRGSMEATWVNEILNKYITKHNLIYHKYLGDAHTSSYKKVVELKPCVGYNIIPEKLECVGHFQKRLGTGLPTKVKEYERYCNTTFRCW